MENETDKNMNIGDQLLAMTDYSMNKLFGESAPKRETDKEFADRIFRQSGLAEKFDQLDRQIKNINNTLREVLTDCHQNDRTAPNSQDIPPEVRDYHPKGEGTAIARICHMCGMPGATVNYLSNEIMTHSGKCTTDFLKNEARATNDFENNSAV